MAAGNRYLPKGVPAHIVQRGANGQFIFNQLQDYKTFIKLLRHYASKYDVLIHAWVLMGNHFHLLATPKEANAISKMMARLGGAYASYFNKLNDRQGTLWQGRFRSCLITSRYYLLCCYRYIELNPVRAGLVGTPEDFVWSSYQCNALGKKSSLCTPHEVYLNLGSNKFERLNNYRACFELELDNSEVQLIRFATHEQGVVMMPGSEERVAARLALLDG